jgi:hypothetical protein
MPCYDPRDDTRVVYEKGHDPQYREEAKRLSQRCQELTNLLCMAGRARHNKTEIPPEVLNWWEDHCKRDRKKGEPW